MSWRFYRAQRAGDIPSNYPLSWITTSMTTDLVQPGWYDAGEIFF
ncbi:MAG: glycoside hydrolase family 9 protein [Taibaiella sp.]|nr:glycoside hydrolase family 9 protein [Taibaiella sp.]MBX9448693.1 glycoside hydrolase family 9 protein [Taibaiella sp.]